MSFELLAPHYTWMERVLAGPRLQRARVAWLDQLAGCERILIAGVGHGHFLRSCAQRFPHLEITSVDASAGMLARARAGLHANPRLKFVHATLPDWAPAAATFDGIATHFFLDCFAPAELRDVVSALARAATPCARWLITDFAVPRHGWKRYRARAIHATMYAFFRPLAGVRAKRVTAPDELMRSEGFTLTGRVHHELGLIQSDVWSRGILTNNRTNEP